MYPVGSCYFSTVNTSPPTIVGGTWAAMTDGMLGLADSTGVAGAANNGGSRKISVDQMPAHSHSLSELFYAHKHNGGHSNINRLSWDTANKGGSVISIESTGGGADYIPAHTSVYGWRRTA